MRSSTQQGQFFYIANKDGRLFGGMSPGDGYRMPSFPTWRFSGDFTWARRFTSVDNALKFARLNRIVEVKVIDVGGRVLATITKDGEVSKGE